MLASTSSFRASRMQAKYLVPAILASFLLGCATPSAGGKKDAKQDSSASSALAGLSSALGTVDAGGQGSSRSDNRLGAVLDVAKAATVTDEEVKSMTLQFIGSSDRKNKVAAKGSKYAARLAKLTSKHVNEDGMKLNFKVYMSPTINAFATADGSIRVYSGLMDLMTDDELRGVIGHEIGHVKYKHSANAIKSAYLASAARKGVASSGGGLGHLADSDLGALGEAMFNSGFSRSQETESDDYGFEFLKRNKYPLPPMESAFRKLAALGGQQGGLAKVLSTHPDSAARADRVHQKIVSASK